MEPEKVMPSVAAPTNLAVNANAVAVDQNHPPFSLVPFDVKNMSYEEYSEKYKAFVMEKIRTIAMSMQQAGGGGGQW